jgi:site-specific DNA recombinase
VNKPKILVGYCRVSTDNQKEEGTIEIQENSLKKYAEKNSYELLKIFKDNGISGASELENRPGLAELFIYTENNKEIEGVLIFKLDRLARDLYIQEHLIKKLEGLNKKLISIKEPHLESNDPMRKAFRQFMGIVSELEKAFITMRLSGGRINKAQKGGYAGGATALGYKTKNKKLIIDEKQAEIIRMIFKMKRYKRMGLREIARELNEKGIPTAIGGKWYAGTIKYILENSLYKGIAHYKENKVKNKLLIVF